MPFRAAVPYVYGVLGVDSPIIADRSLSIAVIGAKYVGMGETLTLVVV